jgi:hypothetical protein
MTAGTIGHTLPGGQEDSHRFLHLVPAPDIWQLHLHLAWQIISRVQTAHKTHRPDPGLRGCDDS